MQLQWKVSQLLLTPRCRKCFEITSRRVRLKRRAPPLLLDTTACAVSLDYAHNEWTVKVNPGSFEVLHLWSFVGTRFCKRGPLPDISAVAFGASQKAERQGFAKAVRSRPEQLKYIVVFVDRCQDGFLFYCLRYELNSAFAERGPRCTLLFYRRHNDLHGQR